MLRPTPSRRTVDATPRSVVGGNAIALAASRAIAVVGALALAAVLSRRLGSDAFGRFGAIAAAGFVANTAITFGTDTVIVRAVSDRRPDARNLTVAALIAQLVGSLMLVVASFVAFSFDIVTGAVVVQAVALVPMAVVTVASAVLRGLERMWPLAVAASASSLVSLLVALSTVDDSSDVGWAVAALAIGQCVAAGVLIASGAVPAAVGGSAEADQGELGAVLDGWWRRVASLASQTWVFAAMVVASAVSLQGVLTLVAALSSRRSGSELDLGGLVASMRLLEAARIAPAAAFGAMLPAAFAGRWPADRMRRWSLALVAYAALVTVVLALAGQRIVELVFGTVAQPELVGVLGLALVPIVFRLQWSTELLGAGRERAVLAASTMGAVASVIVALVAVLAVDVDGDALRLVAAGQVAGVVVSVTALAFVRSAAGSGVPPTESPLEGGIAPDSPAQGSIR